VVNISWKKIGKPPTKSLTELEAEVDKLKEAETNIKKYNELQLEKQKIQSEIQKEGFKQRHAKALSIINRAENIMGKTHKLVTSPKAKKFAKKYL